MQPARLGHDNLGLGVGLRAAHFDHILRHRPAVDWFEVISENFVDSQGRPRYVLQQLAELYPIVLHGVSLSIGSTDRLDLAYLAKLKRLAAEVKARWISDHLCWTGVLGRNTHDLLPVPFTEQTLRHVVERIRVVQDVLERPLVLENPSSYVTFAHSTMSEWEFVCRMAEEADCGLLLDVNNVYVSSFNHDMDAEEFIRALPHSRIVQFHLAGHSNYVTHLIDSHDAAVIDPVWELYRLAHRTTGGVATLLEWDARIPPFPVVETGGRDSETGAEPAAADAASPSSPRAPGGRVSRGREPAPAPGGPPDLDVVQRWFQSVVSHPGGVAEGLSAAGAQQLVPLERGELERLVRRSRRLTAEERLAIYANAYYARLIECLADCFPVLERTLGKEVFAGFACEYLQRYPSRSYTLDRLGESFARFLDETRPDRDDQGGEPRQAAWPDFLIDLARLEWTIARIFDGPGVEQQKLLSAAELTALGPERFAASRLVPVVCLHLLSFRYPVNSYYTAAREAGADGPPPSPPAPGEEHVALTRTDFVVRRHPLSSFQHALLAAITAGAPVAEAIAAAALASRDPLRPLRSLHPLADDGLAAQVMISFRNWTAAGFFQSITI
jgi:uncharacterized protein (UPF0276 family)